jgi:dihydropteroate synthase
MSVQSWAGLPSGRPAVMGILNVTPDSFSDGGRNGDPVSAGLAMIAEGADLIDVGGESTRPGAAPVSVAEEIARIRPVVAGLAARGVVVSIDTRNAETMRVALGEGAHIVNDITALAHDPQAVSVVARAGCPVVLMHMRGEPATMRDFATYTDVVAEVRDEVLARVAVAEEAGIARANIAIDPGIGFAKTAEHNVVLLRHLESLAAHGLPMLVGVSRKGFIGTLSGEPNPARRAGGSVAAALFAMLHGAAILRVHDVAETVQAIRVWRGLAGLS